mmetsp:Transcript_6969/g.30537  ORF Transcript_6969/g.30537 Transcript_6969/m.30537 type:complete len:217 (+) Transcript_6969:3026-3676(+)
MVALLRGEEVVVDERAGFPRDLLHPRRLRERRQAREHHPELPGLRYPRLRFRIGGSVEERGVVAGMGRDAPAADGGGRVRAGVRRRDERRDERDEQRRHLPRHPRGGARDSPAPPGHQGAAHRYPTAGTRRGLATADAARALRVGRLRRPANHARGPGNRAQTQVLPARRAHAGHRHRQRTPEGTRRRFGRISVLCGMRSRVLNPRRNRHPPGAHA